MQRDSSMGPVTPGDSITAKRPGNAVFGRTWVEPALVSLSSAPRVHPLHRKQRSLADLDHYNRPHGLLVLPPSTLHHPPPPLPTGCCSCARNRPLSTRRDPTTKHSKCSQKASRPSMATNSRPLQIQLPLFFFFFSARTTETATTTATATATATATTISSIAYLSAPYLPS